MEDTSAVVSTQSSNGMTETAVANPKPSVSRNAFEKVTSNLLKIGAMTLEQFLDPSALDASPHDHSQQPSFPADELMDTSEPPLTDAGETGSGTAGGPPAHQKAPLFILHKVCSQTFGNIDPIQYEIIEENGKDKKKCILTITRPNGSTRSYATQPAFARKAEAKAAAAAIAVELGALDFIKNGVPDYPNLKKGLVLAPLDAPGSQQTMEKATLSASEDNGFVKQIEECCLEWRAGRVRPHWVQLDDTKPGGKVGCALRIRLSLHSERVYSINQEYDDFAAAKAACAKDAVDQGLLEFIKHGNGQTQPAHPSILDVEGIDAEIHLPPAAMSLQGFFESLPRPFPEPIEGKTAIEINAPSWLNVLIQSEKGTKIVLNFIWIVEPKYALHGAVLRVERPGECKSFLVDPQFPKRADAKAAVCLVGMSQGIGDYVRACGKVVEDKIPPEMRSRATNGIMPILSTEYTKIWPKLPDIYEFSKDRDAYGCTMKLKLVEDPQPEQTRTWTVPPDYRSKTDAKIAVVNLAFEDGAIEFLRFRGEPPPPGYVVTLPPSKRTDGTDSGKKNKKRKATVDTAPVAGSSNMTELGSRKRPKLDDDAKSETSMASSSKAHASLPPKPVAAVTAGAGDADPAATVPVESESGASGAKPKQPGARKAERQQAGAPRRGRGMQPRPRGRDSLGAPEPGELRPEHGYQPYTRGGARGGHNRYASGPRPDERLSDGRPAGAYCDSYSSQPSYEHHPPRQRGGPPYYSPRDPYTYGRDEPYYSHYGTDPAGRYDYPYSQPPYDYHDAQPYPAPPPAVAEPPYYDLHGPGSERYPHDSRSSSVLSSSFASSVQTPSHGHPPASYPGRKQHTPALQPRLDDSDAPRTWVPGPGYAARQMKSPSADAPQDRQSSTASSAQDVQQRAGVPRRGDSWQQKQKGAGGTLSRSKSASGVPQSAALPVEQAIGKGKGKATISGDNWAPAAPRTVKPEFKNSSIPTANSESKSKSSSPDKGSKSYKAALVEYCARSDLPAPRFQHKPEVGEDGEKRYKPWVIVGKEKLELPGTYADLVDGEERLALQVLRRMRAQAKKVKA